MHKHCRYEIQQVQEDCFFKNPLDVLSIFAVFYLGTTGHDISKALGMMGVTEASFFSKIPHDILPKVTKIIREVSKELIQEAIMNEVIVTLKDRHSEFDINSITTTIKLVIETTQYGNVPGNFLPFTISVSYNMGW